MVADFVFPKRHEGQFHVVGVVFHQEDVFGIHDF
jgi:hypothetical protein